VTTLAGLQQRGSLWPNGLPERQPVYAPMWIRDREWMNPKMFRSQTTVPITTTAFKIDLIEPAIGMKLLTSQSRTPTTIKTIKI
jgi:hypothetical protein